MQQTKKEKIFQLEYIIQNQDIEIEGCKFSLGSDLKEIYNDCKSILDKIDKKSSISGLEGYVKEIQKNISTEEQYLHYLLYN